MGLLNLYLIIMKTVSFYTLGCKLNRCETDSIRKGFIDCGYVINDFGQKSDLIVINTCLVTKKAETKCKKIIRKAVRENRSSLIAVIGCFSEIKPEEIRSIKGVDLVLGTYEKYKIFDYIQADQPVKYKNTGNLVWLNHLGYDTNRTRAFLKIQDGCSFFCSYCIIPYARGKSISREKDLIIEQTQKLVNNGYKEIVLTGVNIGDYEGGLISLLENLVKIKELKRIRLSSIEPDFVSKEFIDFVKDNPQICRHLHIPLQSGDNEILKSMNRHYTVEQYESIIKYIKKKMPYTGIGTDVMVGFPDENKSRFENTYDFLKNLPLSYFHVFPYSVREKTKAYSMNDNVSPVEKKKRSKKMISLAEEKKTEFLKKNLGRTEEVLFESTKNGNYYNGFSSNYIKVNINDNNTNFDVFKNSIFKVNLEKIKGFEMVGKIVE